MIDVIFSDDHICVCRKPRGVISEGEGRACLPTLLSETLGGRAVYPVHRLDKETEGLMVYALSAKAAAELSGQIADGRMAKEYIAELLGVPDEKEGSLRDLLFYDRQRGRSYVVDRVRKGVKEAILDYRVLESDGNTARVRVALRTGRTHQIRVQFASRGMPLKGDRRYGAPAGTGELGLTSCYLRFTHPVSGEIMEFGDK